jgi:hypothetical protein
MTQFKVGWVGKTVQGHPARIICEDRYTPEGPNLVSLITVNSCEYAYMHTSDGKVLDPYGSQFELYHLAPNPVEVTPE